MQITPAGAGVLLKPKKKIMNATMNKIGFLNKGKALIKRVMSSREIVIKHGISNVPVDWCEQEIKNIQAALEAISSYERLAKYIDRKEKDLMWLCPSNRKSLKEELETVIDQAKEICEKEFIPTKKRNQWISPSNKPTGVMP